MALHCIIWRICVVIFFITTAGHIKSVAYAEEQEDYHSLKLFGEFIEAVRDHYYQEIEMEWLVDAAIEGIMSRLDERSAYIGPNESITLNDSRDQSASENFSVGIDVAPHHSALRVIRVIPTSPAERAGVSIGDAIISMNGELVSQITLADAMDILQGPRGAAVQLTVMREGLDDNFEIELERELEILSTVVFRMEGNIGYINVQSMSPGLVNAAANSIESIKLQLDNEFSGFVLDFRGNSGGLLAQSIELTDIFLDQGLIFFVQGRSDIDNRHYLAHDGDRLDGKPMIVLVNGGTAMGAEIVAAALQDHQRAVLVGTRTLGRASIQTFMRLRAGGAIRLTTSYWRRPSGASIEGQGSEPDHIVDQPLPASLEGGDVSASTYVPTNSGDDIQLQFALTLLRMASQ